MNPAGIKALAKALARKIALSLAAVCMLISLCSCGSELNGTWTSQSDSTTTLKFSGSKVTAVSGEFKISGTYETDDEGNITFTFTSSDGSKYKITAQATITNSTMLTLTNADGETEVFKK